MTQQPLIANSDLIDEYLKYQSGASRRRPWRTETVRVRRYQLTTLAAALAPVTLQDATEDDLLRWHDNLQGRPETVAAFVSAAHGIYRWMAVNRRPRLRGDDPTLLLERPVIPEAPPRPMLDRHYDLALACALHDPELYLWLGLMGCSGLRCCEVAWLHVGDVELREDGRGILHVTGKGGKRRPVPIGATIAMTLQPFLMRRGPVFTRPSDGQAYRPRGVSEKTNTFLRGIGITETAHQLRHRFGTDYHELDVDLFRQAQLMGHSSVVTTKRYTAVSPLEAAQYVELLTQRRLRRAAGRRAA